MKEQIKVYGILSEVFEEDIVPFMPRILKNLEKTVVSEGTNRLHGAISETIGTIVFNIIDKIEDEEAKRDFFDNQILAFLFTFIEKSSNKVVQTCGINILSKVIINCPDDVLLDGLDFITSKMAQVLKIKNF